MKPLKHRVLAPNSITIIDSFLTDEQCRWMLEELNLSCWRESRVLRERLGKQHSVISADFRSSVSADQEWFGSDLLREIRLIEGRLAKIFGSRAACLEPWQATKYQAGDQFRYHLDCGSWKRTSAGERRRTFLLYLRSPRGGGQTHFRALNRLISPKRGRLVAWSNLLDNGNCNHAMIHSGLEVTAGVKITLVTWERERCIERTPRT